MENTSQFKKTLAFVQKHHAGQFRDNGLPAWHHLFRVSRLLSCALQKTKEGEKSWDYAVIPLAALGHDIFEDTKATEKEVLSVFGTRGLELIKGMTNWWGDKEKPRYIKQICESEEAVRLIKLADLCDNYTSVVYNIKSLGVNWITSYFLPIVSPMRKAIAKTKFKIYPKTSSLLLSQVETYSIILEEEITLLSRELRN